MYCVKFGWYGDGSSDLSLTSHDGFNGNPLIFTWNEAPTGSLRMFWTPLYLI